MPSKIPTYRPPGPATGKLYDATASRRADKAFYSSARWIRLRDQVRRDEPLCRACKAEGRITLTSAIDHILGRKDRPDLALDRSNLQGLCKSCHNAKRDTSSAPSRSSADSSSH